MTTVFDSLDQPTPASAPPAGGTIFDALPAPAIEEHGAPQKTVFDALPATSGISPSNEQPKPEAQGFVNKAWDWLNSPLVSSEVIDRAISGDMTGAIQPPSTAATALGGAKHGAENFAAGLTTPATIGLAVASMGGSLVEQGLVKAGVPLLQAAGIVQKAKLGADLAFLTKYGYDLGTQTLPNLEMAWGDYRAATTDKDKRKALDRLSEMGTESVLNAVAAGFATKGIARDVNEIVTQSPKGKAMANEQYSQAVYGYQEENQVGTAQARQDFDEYTKRIKDPYRRTLIARSIEAGADPNVLEAQARTAEANPKTKATAQEFRDAKSLTDDEITARDELRNKLAGDLAHLKALNLLPEDGGKPNYLPHKWDVEDADPATGKPVERTLVDGDRDMLKKRKFDTIADGEQKGLKPTTTDAAALISDYHERVSNLIAKNNLAEKLAGSYTNEGSPMAAPGKLFPGYTKPVDSYVEPSEVANLKNAGKFDELLRTGRIYEIDPKTVKPAPMQGEPGLVVANKLPVRYDATEVPSGKEQHAYMWKQSDYVPSGLSVWHPVSAAEAAELPKGTAIVPFGQSPNPEEAVMQKGAQGVPGAEATPTDKVANARVPVYVHPDIAPHLEPMLEITTPKNALVKALLKASSKAKSDLLSLSPFHWNTILNRTLEAGMNPFKGGNRKFIFAPKDIDYYNLTDSQQSALRDGVVVSSTRPGFSGYLDEGLAAEHDSIINKIPLIGDFNRAIEGKLFGPHGWITSLKFDLYDKLRTEIQKSQPTLDTEQAGRIAAAQVNNKFGGLNYTVLGRGASTQNALRAMLLAPDFLESTGRSILDVAGDHGGPLVKSLVAFNAAQWLAVRGLNYLVSGNTHPESGNSVLSKDGKREYNLRTTLGDFLHFAENPRDFVANRVNPLLVRAPAELAEGEDQMGHKVTDAQQFFDTLRQVTPIPLQGLYPNQQVSQASAGDKVLQSLGVQSRKKFTPAETLAQQLMTKRSGEGAPLEGDDLAKAQLHYKLEDQLRTAINARDNKAKIDALKEIHAASSGADAKLTEKEASSLIQQANKYPSALQATTARLSLEDALQVWDKTGLTEQRALRPIIQEKIEKWMLSSSTRTRQQNDSMRLRIQAFRRSLAE